MRGRGLLVAWSLALVLCDLLDEIAVVTIALLLRESWGAGEALTLLALGLLPAGGAFGLIVTERLLGRTDALRLMLLAAAPCVAALLVLALVPWAPAMLAATFVIGFTAAPFWPLAKAQAYRASEEDSDVVNAVDSALAPLSVVLPLALAAAGSAWGLEVALLLLAAEPIGVAAVAGAVAWRRRDV